MTTISAGAGPSTTAGLRPSPPSLAAARADPGVGEKVAHGFLVIAAARCRSSSRSGSCVAADPRAAVLPGGRCREFLTGTRGRRGSRQPSLRRPPPGDRHAVDHGDRPHWWPSRSASARRSTCRSTPRPATRKILKPILELLAGIPSVVYGFFAVDVRGPVVLKDWLGIEVGDLHRARRPASCSAS